MHPGADMAEIASDFQHVATLTPPGLTVELFADPRLAASDPLISSFPAAMESLWPHYAAIARETGVLDTLGLDPDRHALEIELTLVGDAAMQAINREYRGKNEPTDVLSFTLLADAPDPAPWLALPAVQLGSLFLSPEWAESHAEPGQALPYLLERFVHGMLHLMGEHHDSMPAYERVVDIQKRVLARWSGEPA